MPLSDGAESEAYEQVVPLDRRYAARTAALGALVFPMGGVVAWLEAPEPWPTRLGATLAFVPVLALGGFIVALAAVLHWRRATWRLCADDEAVTLEIRAADGRSIKRERVALEDLEALVWIEGDADVAAGLRRHARRGRSLLIPADAFDVEAAWGDLRRRHPQLPTQRR